MSWCCLAYSLASLSGFYPPKGDRKIFLVLGARCTKKIRERTFGSMRFCRLSVSWCCSAYFVPSLSGFYLPKADRKTLFLLRARCTNNFRERTFGSRRFQKPVHGQTKKTHSISPFTYTNYYTKSILPSTTFRGIQRAALGLQNSILGIRNSTLGMASHNLSNTIPAILGATPVSECMQEGESQRERKKERKREREKEGERERQRQRGAGPGREKREREGETKRERAATCYAAPASPRKVLTAGGKRTRKKSPSHPQEREKEKEEKKKKSLGGGGRGGKTRTQNPTGFSSPNITKTETEPPESHQSNVRACAPKPPENNPLERENSKKQRLNRRELSTVGF